MRPDDTMEEKIVSDRADESAAVVERKTTRYDGRVRSAAAVEYGVRPIAERAGCRNGSGEGNAATGTAGRDAKSPIKLTFRRVSRGIAYARFDFIYI